MLGQKVPRLVYQSCLFLYLIIPIYCVIKRDYYDFKFIFLPYFLTACVIYALRKKKGTAKISLAIDKEKVIEQANLLDTQITRDLRIISALEHNVGRYAVLKELAEELIGSFSLNNTVGILFSKINGLVAHPGERIKLYLLDAEKQRLGLFAYCADKADSALKQCPVEFLASDADEPGRDIFNAWVFKHQIPLLIEETQNDFRFDTRRYPAKTERFGSLISAPLIAGKRIIGILRLELEENKGFSDDDLRILSVVSDLAALSIDNCRLYQRIQELAITDGLTGLHLRQYFMLRFNEYIGPAAGEKKFSLLILDIDRFKDYNDKFGHIAGDIVLKVIARILKDNSPKDGMLARYGGEEFVALFPDSDKERAKEIAERIRRAIEAEKVVLRRVESSVTVSIGVSVFGEDGVSSEALLSKADARLYKAKKRGRNRVCFS